MNMLDRLADGGRLMHGGPAFPQQISAEAVKRSSDGLQTWEPSSSEREGKVVPAPVADATKWRVALVNVPFASHRRPSIQLGLLSAIAEQHGFRAQTMHLNLDFAARVGTDLYHALCDFGRCFIGDWVFSRAAFGSDTPPQSDEFLERFRGPVAAVLDETGATDEDLRRLRDVEVPAFLEESVDSIPWQNFRVVGFTSTFQQNVAAFALARRLKERWPELVTVFGGANFEGEMGVEWTRAIPAVDYAVLGEGDVTFPELLLALQAGQDGMRVPGVVARRGGLVAPPKPRPLYRELDRLPMPNYDEYFQRAERLGLIRRAQRSDIPIPYESARGCWWGAKHHCTFCGLNGAGMAFRTKSAGRIKSELRAATIRYRSWRFEATDNIFDMALMRGLLPELASDDSGYELFYEVKANLSRQQLKLLASAGVRVIQPGIESLSTSVLKLMKKGITAIQNVNTLRWAYYYGITVSWSLLYGFPGETVDDYRRQEQLIPHLRHLQPPVGVCRIWMERFSPMFSDRDSFPARFIRPHSSYAYIHPERVDLTRVAYFFDYEFDRSVSDEVLEPTAHLVADWRNARAGAPRWGFDRRFAWRPAQDGEPRLTFRAVDGFVQIFDERDPAKRRKFTLEGTLAKVFTALCDRPSTLMTVMARLDQGSERRRIEAAMPQLCDEGLVMQDGDYFLALPLPAHGGR